MSLLLLLNALAHFAVDGLCASCIFESEQGTMLIYLVIYNTLAFSTQCFVGMIQDRTGKTDKWALISVLMIIIGWVLPVHQMIRTFLIGLGNSGFHVAGGIFTLESSQKSWPLGVFVAPGAMGLTLGTLFPQTGVIFAVILAIYAVSIIPLSKKHIPVRSEPLSGKDDSKEAMFSTVLLSAAVAVRAIGGSVVEYSWKQGTTLTVLMTVFVVAGKMFGGAVCDKLGPVMTSFISIMPACILIPFFSSYIVPSLLGQFAINLTMPVTLWLMYRVVPDSPGFAFGLAASALWPGTVLAMIFTLTGPIMWICVIVSFVFGLFSIIRVYNINNEHKEIRS